MAGPGRPTVLFLHPSDELYGADRQLLTLVRSARRICRPVVVLPVDVSYQGQLSRQLLAEGIEIRRGPLPVLRRSYLRPTRVPGWLFDATRGLWWLLTLARATRPAAVVTNSTAIPAGPPLARLLGIPHIWYVRELVESPAWYASMVRSVARIARGTVITNSRAVARWLGPIKGRDVVPIHNAVPPSLGLVPLSQAPTAVFVGRLNAWKGWEVFAAAAGSVHEQLPGSRFVLAGGTVRGSEIDDGRVRSVLDSVDPSRGWLTWLGEIADARELMRSAWVVVVPSTQPEPFGNVAIEGMAEGRAVIASNLGGLPEIVIHDESGLLVPPGSADGLARAMSRLLADRAGAEQMGAAALRRYEEAFTPSIHEEAWMSVLARTLQVRSRAT